MSHRSNNFNNFNHFQHDNTNKLLEDIKTNTENININVDTLEVNTDGLEGLQTTTNTKLNGGLPSALTGSGNLKVCIQELGNEGSERLNVDIGDDINQLPTALTGEGNLKVSIQEDHTHNLATSANQSTANGHLATIAGDTTSIDGKITACNTGAVVVSSSVLPSGASTASLQGGGLPSALSSDNLKVSLKESIAVGVTNTTLTNLNNCIDSNEMQCDIVASALPSGASTASLQGGGLPSALSSDNLKVSLKESIAVGVTNASLTALNSAINSDKVDVNISSGGFDGAVTNAGLTALASCIGTDGDGSGPSKCISIAGTGVLGDIQEILVGGTGKLQVDISTSALPTGASTSALQGTLNTKIDTIDSQIDLLEGTNTIKDVEWLSNASISNQALSDVLDTEGYERVFIYGENSSSVSANNFKIFGSNQSAGTYYSVGQLAVVTSDSGRYLLREDTPVADMPSPRYLKVFNNTGSSQTITKLRAVMSHKLRYI